MRRSNRSTGRGGVLAVALLAGLLSWDGSPARAATDEDCLGCHAVGADVVELPEQLLVATEAWTGSLHAQLGLGCVDCHAGKDGYPHDPADVPARCSNCHADAAAAFAGSIHGQIPASHAGVSPFPLEDPCARCHGVHDVRAVSDPESRVYYRNIPATCGTCHGDLQVVGANGLTTAPADDYANSVHGLALNDPEARPAVCTACHGAHDITLASNPASPINPFNVPKTCGQCHATEFQEYSGSVHGVAASRGVTAAPSCPDCHGIHSIKMVAGAGADPNAQRLVRTTCPACHSSEALMGALGVSAARVSSYYGSYHGLANKRGNAAVADCASCHGVHAIYPSTDERSTIAPANLQQTCGGCHPGAGEEFARHPVHFAPGDAADRGTVITGWVTRVYWVLIVLVIGGMLAHNLVILSHYMRRRVAHESGLPARARFSRSQMLQHGALFVSFFALAFTGFMLAYPQTWWSQLFMNLGVTESIRRWVHRGAALVLLGAGIYHVGWALFTSYGRAELRRILPGLRDWHELQQNMRFHLGRSPLHAAFAKYDYPAKAEYWALVWGTVVMALTGFVLWFPVAATALLPVWILKVSEVIHLFEAWLATLAILVFHFFYVMAHPEIYPLNLAMFRGTLPAEHARHHHPQWTPDADAPLNVAAASNPTGGTGGSSSGQGHAQRPGAQNPSAD